MVIKRLYYVALVVASMLLAACASPAHKSGGGSDGPGRVTASGYTKEGCLLNLKLAARERKGRLVPDDVQIKTNWLMLVFPFLNQEGYHCSGSFTEREKRSLSKDPLYPME
ncbi:MAG: hypothetical protein A4E19_06945 [Nitrospira sp. SG-bin1]|nr:MAG: hypothetical protein A4E19_06945 [Nitrospira sp. SG-bin1]